MNEFELKTLSSNTKVNDVLKIISTKFENNETYYYAFYKYRDLVLCLPLSRPLVECSSMELKTKFLSLEINSQRTILDEILCEEEDFIFKTPLDRDFIITRSFIENQILFLLNAENDILLSKAFSPFEIDKEIKKFAKDEISKLDLFKKILFAFDIDARAICNRHNIDIF